MFGAFWTSEEKKSFSNEPKEPEYSISPFSLPAFIEFAKDRTYEFWGYSPGVQSDLLTISVQLYCR